MDGILKGVIVILAFIIVVKLCMVVADYVGAQIQFVEIFKYLWKFFKVLWKKIRKYK